jgi:hypothetical protein
MPITKFMGKNLSGIQSSYSNIKFMRKDMQIKENVDV